MDYDQRSQLPPGIVKVELVDDGWCRVSIGRLRKIKQFYLSRAEVAELVRVLRAEVLTKDEGGL